MRIGNLAFIAIIVGASACALEADPQYVTPAPPLNALEWIPGTSTTDMPPSAMAIQVPIDMRRIAEDEPDRLDLATELGIDAALVPTIRHGDLDVAIEYSIKNLDAMAEAKVDFEIYGGNEFYWVSVDRASFIDAEEEPPPPLIGDQAPIYVPPGATVTGVFREDQISEVGVDIDQITRGNINYIAAHLSNGDDERDSFQP